MTKFKRSCELEEIQIVLYCLKFYSKWPVIDEMKLQNIFLLPIYRTVSWTLPSVNVFIVICTFFPLIFKHNNIYYQGTSVI